MAPGWVSSYCTPTLSTGRSANPVVEEVQRLRMERDILKAAGEYRGARFTCTVVDPCPENRLKGAPASRSSLQESCFDRSLRGRSLRFARS